MNEWINILISVSPMESKVETRVSDINCASEETSGKFF